MTVEDNTNSIIAALSGIADAITAGFAEVMAALGAIQTGVDAIDSELSTVHGEVDAIHGEVDAISEDVADIGDAVSGIDDKIDAVNTAIAGAAAALAQPDPAVAAIAEGVTANSVAINSLTDQLAEVNSMLEMISEEVGVVQETVETGPAPTTTNMLHSDDTEQTVAVADFAGSVTKHPNDGVYEASNTFSCTGDVFLDSMTVSDVNDILSDQRSAISANPALPVTIVTVNGFSLYETFTADDPVVAASVIANIGKVRDFDNQFLSAGSTLVIKGSTDQSVDADDTNDPTDIGTADGETADKNLLVYTSNATANDAAANTGNVVFTLADYVELESNKDTIGAVLVQIRVLSGLCSFRARVFGRDGRILSGWMQIAAYRPT